MLENYSVKEAWHNTASVLCHEMERNLIKGGAKIEKIAEQLRKERGLSQEAFAKTIRVSRQTVSAIETGKYNPSLDLAFISNHRGT